MNIDFEPKSSSATSDLETDGVATKSSNNFCQRNSASCLPNHLRTGILDRKVCRRPLTSERTVSLPNLSSQDLILTENFLDYFPISQDFENEGIHFCLWKGRRWSYTTKEVMGLGLCFWVRKIGWLILLLQDYG